MDRLHFADWSAALGDDEFARALAALGAIHALPAAAIDAALAATSDDRDPPATLAAAVYARLVASDRLEWRLAEARRGRLGLPPGRGGRRRPALNAADFAQVWQIVADRCLLDDRAGPRLALLAPATAAARLLPCLRWLARPAVGAASVFAADLFAADGRNDWRWPFTVATLPDDPLAAALARMQAEFPQPWPFRFADTDAADARAEILVIGATPAAALQRILAARLRLRCCLLIVAGSGREDAGEVEPLLRGLVGRFSAEGAVVVDAGSAPQELAAGLRRLATALCHDQPLDLALWQAFGSRAVPLLNADLLALSRLSGAVGELSQRLRGLPPETPIALSAAAAKHLRVGRGAVAKIVAAELSTALDGSRAGDDFAAATGLAELAPQVAAAEAGTRPPRHVQQRSLSRRSGRLAEIRDGYVRGEAVTLRLHIGPLRRGRIAAAEAFPEDLLPPRRGAHRLQLVLHEPRQFAAPLQAEILLPRDGDSERAEFVFVPQRVGDFAARLSVLHRGRVLQTLLLRTRVAATADRLGGKSDAGGDGIALDVEAAVRQDWSDLGVRRRFDLALVLNHTPQGQPRLTGVAGRRAWATDLRAIAEPVREINALISQVALDLAAHADGLDQGGNPKLLAALARIGADLYSQLYLDQLQPLARGGFDPGSDAVTHIQVVATRSDAIVPIEFIYDLMPPDADAGLCPKFRAALAAGKCGASCPARKTPERYVCPLGFWGLRKVIERHFYSPQVGRPDDAEVILQAEPAAGRERLPLDAGVLLGWSDQVKARDGKALAQKLAKTLKARTTIAADWPAWKQAVAGGPSLLLAFPHNAGSRQSLRLEIGGSLLSTLRLAADYVRPPAAPPPLVFLLGCDTAGSAEDYANHVRYFRQAGAAAVVSTIATVFGGQAVAVGERIVAGLLAGRRKPGARLGEIIRDARRAALRDSLPMALCVVAFGDADWRL